MILFDYDPSRSSQVPNRLLADYKGALMVDGYEGYHAVCQSQSITRLDCWVHARRKFVEVNKANKKNNPQASYVIKLIARLYVIEKALQGAPPTDIYATRHTRSKPIIDKLASTWRKNHGFKNGFDFQIIDCINSGGFFDLSSGPDSILKIPLADNPSVMALTTSKPVKVFAELDDWSSACYSRSILRYLCTKVSEHYENTRFGTCPLLSKFNGISEPRVDGITRIAEERGSYKLFGFCPNYGSCPELSFLGLPTKLRFHSAEFESFYVGKQQAPTQVLEGMEISSSNFNLLHINRLIVLGDLEIRDSFFESFDAGLIVIMGDMSIRNTIIEDFDVREILIYGTLHVSNHP